MKSTQMSLLNSHLIRSINKDIRTPKVDFRHLHVIMYALNHILTS